MAAAVGEEGRRKVVGLDRRELPASAPLWSPPARCSTDVLNEVLLPGFGRSARQAVSIHAVEFLGVPGDGRCLFRSVVLGACLRAGKPPPSEGQQKELADELRSKVADEFVKRREDTEWFLEGDFDTYIRQIRQPHIWGGEPELLMCSHVLKMPITVYMCDKNSDGLKVIAEYGQEYGKTDPIRVLYHGYGHYDALQIPLTRSTSKLSKRR